MLPPKRFYVVDDDPFAVAILERVLDSAGYEVRTSLSSVQALKEIIDNPPDCVLVDLMMPEMDGFELTHRLRERPELKQMRIVVVSAKSYEADRRKAREMGADAYIAKPVRPESFLGELQGLLENKAEIRYWGVRGTLPVPGAKSLRYGGNTSCVSLEFGNEGLFIFDAGSGIKELSNALMTRKGRITGRIFISHPHWDHINGLPFFAPLYVQGNEFVIHGAAQGGLDMRELISAQMEQPYFPVTVREFGANVYFNNLREERVILDGVSVQTMLLRHPGNCLGYRVELRGGSFCYITDNELYPEHLPQYDEHQEQRLIGFLSGADVLVADSTYDEFSYPKRVDWGHSSVKRVAEIAHKAGVRELHLFHHDPDQTDDDIDHKLAEAREVLKALNSKTRVIAPAEGDSYLLSQHQVVREAETAD
jgi:phosphoribosyl 1,2-cyclic phosphodiesterase/CheY-like chemotaxis protein